jgi:hypothetical protein
MNDLSRQHHWEKVYTTKGESEVSWFQETPVPSLELSPAVQSPCCSVNSLCTPNVHLY